MKQEPLFSTLFWHSQPRRIVFLSKAPPLPVVKGRGLDILKRAALRVQNHGRRHLVSEVSP